jgi:uncharacterized protein GlcG (DUF336 family)
MRDRSRDRRSRQRVARQAISKAKAYTANAYSTDDMPLSTARLYTLTQPGHSLWGVSQPNPFRTDCLVPPHDLNATNGKVCGGSIAFGGGVPLYRGKTRVGGLDISGDTACADHEIAKRIRHLAQLDPEKGEFADDIVFTSTDGPSPFAHPSVPTPGAMARNSGTRRRRSATKRPCGRS